MLFNINDDSVLFNDYYNLANENNMKMPTNISDVLTPKQGLNLGNMFASEYDRYKDYRPRELKATNAKEKALLEIRELAFAVNDLNLKLDVDPNNLEYFSLFKEYARELDEKVRNYSNNYDVLEVCLDLKNNYTWYKNPWPWEVDKNV